jgi:hypothetical protein
MITAVLFLWVPNGLTPMASSGTPSRLIALVAFLVFSLG